MAEEAPSIADIVVLEKTVQLNALLITEDKDFGEMAFRLGMQHCRILLIRANDLPLQERINTVLRTIEQFGDEIRNHFAVLDKKQLSIKT